MMHVSISTDPMKPSSDRYEFDWWGIPTVISFHHNLGEWRIENEVHSVAVAGDIKYVEVSPGGNAIAIVQEPFWNDERENTTDSFGVLGRQNDYDFYRHGQEIPLRKLVLVRPDFKVRTVYTGHFFHKRLFWSPSGHGLAAVIFKSYEDDRMDIRYKMLLVSSDRKSVQIPRGSIIHDVLVMSNGQVVVCSEKRGAKGQSRILGPDLEKVVYSTYKLCSPLSLELDSRLRPIARFTERLRHNGRYRRSHISL
jgi:hypothetical protein